MAKRFSLARLHRTDDVFKIIGNSSIHFSDYSLFKHGSGPMSQHYGILLGDKFANIVPNENIVVTSSGYNFVPPSAHSLVAPFIQRFGPRALPFKINRTSISDGDYAKMPLEERQKALANPGLSTETDLTGKTVIALDDVRVTGIHEKAVDKFLRDSGAKTVYHGYIIDAWSVRHDPTTEAMLNASGIKNNTELLSMIHSLGHSFIPNARFVKRVLLMSQRQQKAFLSECPPWLRRWIYDAIVSDNLIEYAAYKTGSETALRIINKL